MLALFALLSQDLGAAETFRKIEDVALKAKSLRVGSTIRLEKDGRATLEFWGKAAFKEGGRQAWELRFGEPGIPKTYRIVTDGARMFWEEPGWSSAAALPKTFDRIHRMLVVRVGLYQAFMFMYTPYHPGKRDQDPADEASWKVGDFSRGPDDGARKSLVYSIWILGAEKPWRMKLLYDPKTWAVLGHAFGTDDEKLKQATPTLLEWAMDVDLPDDLFKIPAGK